MTGFAAAASTSDLPASTSICAASTSAFSNCTSPGRRVSFAGAGNCATDQSTLAPGKVECASHLITLPLASLDNGLNPAILSAWRTGRRTCCGLPGSGRWAVNDILRWPGAVQTATLSQGRAETRRRWRACVKPWMNCRSRQREGAKLKQHILDRLGSAEAQVRPAAAAAGAGRPPSATNWRKRLRDALGEGRDERLAQEVARRRKKPTSTRKSRRAKHHFSEVRRVLNQAGAIGKRLDFLMQELHREAIPWARNRSRWKPPRLARNQRC